MPHDHAPNQAASDRVLTPMQCCERLIGPPEVLGPAIGYGLKAAYHWRREREGRRPGDMPSAEVMRLLLAHSTAQGLGLTADHLIWGAEEAEIAEILAARQTEPAPAFTSRRVRAA